MSNIEFTDKQFWKMCDAQMSRAIPLSEADFTKPFVYDRTYGFFYVSGGYHPMAMSLLLAFHHDSTDPVDLARSLGVRFSEGTADKWLEMNGTCFRSSVGNRVCVGYRKNLNIMEHRLFGDVQELFD